MKTPFWLFIIAILCPGISQAQTLKDQLSTPEKVLGLSILWSEANYNFVFLDKLGFDFDSLYQATIPKVIEAKDNFEYIHVLRKFLEQLNDGHTGIMYNQFYWDQGDYPPVFLDKKKERFFVRSIDEAVATEIPPGSELLTADGIPYADFKKLSPAGNLFSYVHTPVDLKFKTPAGKIVSKRFTRNYNHLYRTENPIKLVSGEKDGQEEKWVPYAYEQIQDFSIVRVNTFDTDKVVKHFEADISKVNQSKGLILDVRQNGGGNSEYSKGIAKYLVEREILVGPLWKTRIHNGARRAWGSTALFGGENNFTRSHKDYYEGKAWQINAPDTTWLPTNLEKITVPIVVLMGAKTFSAAEDFLIYTLGNSNITKIGQNSGGSSGQPLIIELPGGVLARICAKRDALPDGTDYIGEGIQPDISLPEGEDALAYAIKMLKEQ